MIKFVGLNLKVLKNINTSQVRVEDKLIGLITQGSARDTSGSNPALATNRSTIR